MKNYELLCQQLGINRGKLEEGFPQENPSPAIGVGSGKHPPVRKAKGPRAPIPPGPDLSHLNSPQGADIAQRTRDWWRNLPADRKLAITAARADKLRGRKRPKRIGL